MALMICGKAKDGLPCVGKTEECYHRQPHDPINTCTWSYTIIPDSCGHCTYVGNVGLSVALGWTLRQKIELEVEK